LVLYNGFVVLNPNATGNTYYDVASQSQNNPDFSGTLFTIVQGQSILLGGEVSTSPGRGDADGADYVRMYYRVDSGSFSFVNLPFNSNVGNDDKWQEAANDMVQIGSSLSAGNHTLTVYFLGHDNNQSIDAYLNNAGANYSATIQVVPEPVNVALGIFGVLAAGSFAWRRYLFRRA